MSKVLAIESAIWGGSLCLLSGDGAVLAETVGETEVARAEDLLLNIDRLIDQTSLSLKEIRLIAVSNGPGSYTGIRVGIATGLGLARSLKADCVGVSVLEAIAASPRPAGEFIVVVPFGRHGFAWQRFMRGEALLSTSDIHSGDTEDLRSIINVAHNLSIVVPPRLYRPFSEVFDGQELAITGANLAQSIGKAAIRTGGHLPPKALYIRSGDNRITRKA